MWRSSYQSKDNSLEPRLSHFPSKFAVPVFNSNKQDWSLTNMSRRSCSTFLFHFSWQLNKRYKSLERIQLNTSECNTPMPMIWTSRNNFANSFKSYAHSKKERRMTTRHQSILTNTWRLSSPISMECKVKTNKQKLYWWHSVIFIKKPNGMDKTCTCKFSKSCKPLLSKTYNPKALCFKPELANSMLNMGCMHSKIFHI